ncbi:methionyl-tRNA formyltransferase [Desulfovibrio ferrophilus]|uniref:Methionyl-tRNA formyltransferase n=1 Tax=Desulfovibrio ferrophilus TaxID=241368 RepID=A0A2Z6B1N7_9BACT|nr:methionyl-tRNA formyltransferase [Desulfovibrio ferrophilus]BBD09373.1 methionyl-tRNA formyltransferase [Desulfovibrio ferrophilus]
MAASAGQGEGKLRIVFMGTPEFARISLEHLHAWDGAEIVAVYTQPDRPCGRGRKCKPSDVKVFAMEHDIPVLQPENFKADKAVEELAVLAPDLLIVAAYGLILPQRVLDIPREGAINVHGSLLPKYRGAAPIQRAIMNDEAATGITIMQMDAGMDTGDILFARSLFIGKDDTAETLHDELAELGGKLLVEALERKGQNKLVRIPQNDAKATYAAKLEKHEGEIHWNQPAQDVHNRARAMHPWPGAYFTWSGDQRTGKKEQRLVLTPGSVGFTLPEPQPEPGTILGICEGMLAIACTDKAYLVPSLKPAGKKLLTAEAFACGYLDNCPNVVCPDEDDA